MNGRVEGATEQRNKFHHEHQAVIGWKARCKTGLLLVTSLFWAGASEVQAHEDTETHARLSVASLLFLDQAAPQDGALFSVSARSQIRQGSIDEDNSPNFGNHFFNPKTGEALSGLWDTAPKRASDFWTEALTDYRAGRTSDAFAKLGYVMHLLQDMTSPAHVHVDDHGTPRLGHCEGDGDDFEIWGYCSDIGINGILQYVDYSTLANSQIQPPLAIGLDRIFDNQPQRATRRAGDINTGYTYVRELADRVYDFTTFHVKLVDTSDPINNDPGEGELKRMFAGLVESGASWNIPEIGFSFGECGSVLNQEWWMMPTDCSSHNPSFGTHVVEGFAYLENIGGGSGGTFQVPDNVYPAEYDRPWFIRRYNSKFNSGPTRRTMLRIYGDVLYPSAVAYGAGLLRAFLDEVLPPPVADAGGPYEGEKCKPVVFNASGSRDPNGQIIKYEWDFDNNGSFDIMTASPVITHTYLQEYSGVARLRVTDNDGRIGEDFAQVFIGPDITPPQILTVTATPNRLWPPNHKMVRVRVEVTFSDACGASCKIVAVSSDEPDDVRGSGNASPDWQITGDLTVNLRAERSGTGDGRVYGIAIECTDAAGNSSTVVGFVRVTHDKKRSGTESYLLETKIAPRGSQPDASQPPASQSPASQPSSQFTPPPQPETSPASVTPEGGQQRPKGRR